MYRYTKFDECRKFALTAPEKSCIYWAMTQLAKIRPKEELFWIKPMLLNLYPFHNCADYLHRREARVARLAILLFGGTQFVKPHSDVLKVNLMEKLDFMLGVRPLKTDVGRDDVKGGKKT